VIKLKRMGWEGNVAQMGVINAYKIFIQISEGRPRCKWEDNIKMFLKEIGCQCVDLIQITQDGVQ
jgi:hypothetical protein